MAIPTLVHQIQFVDTIVILRAVDSNGEHRYKIDDVLKCTFTKIQAGEYINADLSIFRLLGYKINEHQQIVALLAIRKDLTHFDCIDFLPVEDNRITYGKEETRVHQQITLDDFKTLVRSQVKRE